MPNEDLTIALAKLEAMSERHPSMVMFSEAKLLYRLVPTLRDMLEAQLEVSDNPDILAIASIIAEEVRNADSRN